MGFLTLHYEEALGLTFPVDCLPWSLSAAQFGTAVPPGEALSRAIFTYVLRWSLSFFCKRQLVWRPFSPPTPPHTPPSKVRAQGVGGSVATLRANSNHVKDKKSFTRICLRLSQEMCVDLIAGEKEAS